MGIYWFSGEVYGNVQAQCYDYLKVLSEPITLYCELHNGSSVHFPPPNTHTPSGETR